jgi:hypothetical protein
MARPPRPLHPSQTERGEQCRAAAPERSRDAVTLCAADGASRAREADTLRAVLVPPSDPSLARPGGGQLVQLYRGRCSPCRRVVSAALRGRCRSPPRVAADSRLIWPLSEQAPSEALVSVDDRSRSACTASRPAGSWSAGPSSPRPAAVTRLGGAEAECGPPSRAGSDPGRARRGAILRFLPALQGRAHAWPNTIHGVPQHPVWHPPPRPLGGQFPHARPRSCAHMCCA